MASARTRLNVECWGMGARYVGRRHATTQPVLIMEIYNPKRAQGCSPWSPPQGGARDQSASARRGLPSKGGARALHHQPRPSIDLVHALPLLTSNEAPHAIGNRARARAHAGKALCMGVAPEAASPAPSPRATPKSPAIPIYSAYSNAGAING